MGGRDPHGYGRLVLTHDGLERKAARRGQGEVKVGLIDSGVTLGADGALHQFLKGSVDYRPATDVEPADEVTGHGSFVAGIILDEATTAKVIARRAVTADQGPEEDKQVAAAITELGSQVELINLSFGGSVSEQSTPEVIAEALEALPPEVVVVAAVANNASPLVTYPAAHEKVLSVGAATRDGKIAEFSGFGAWIDLYAPGVEITGPVGAKDFGRWSGTSLAAAVVTGQIANAMSFGKSALTAKADVLKQCRSTHLWDINGPRDVLVLPPSLYIPPEFDLPIPQL
jgi:subtilisin family serine protease